MQSRLIAIRRYHNQTQQYVANVINVSRESYSRKENGKAEFTLTEMFDLAKHFNVPIGSLFLPNDFTSCEGGE